MMNKLMEDLKEEERVFDEQLDIMYVSDYKRPENYDILDYLECMCDFCVEIKLSKARRKGCTKIQAEEAIKDLNRNFLPVVNAVWNKDYKLLTTPKRVEKSLKSLNSFFKKPPIKYPIIGIDR